MDVKKLVADYEAKVEAGLNFYMEADDLLDIVDYYLNANRPEDADRCLDFALRLHPDNEDVLLSKAYRLKDNGLWTVAKKIVRSLSDQTVHDVQLFYVEELLAQAELTQADALFRSLLPTVMTSSDSEWFEDYAELLLDYGYYRRALKLLEAVPTFIPRSKRYLELQSEAFYRLKDYPRSARLINRLIDLDPYNEAYWVQLADIQCSQGLYSDGKDSCDYALAINPHSLRALHLNLIAASERDDIQEAAKAAKACLDEYPDDYFPFMQMGELYFKRESWPVAETYFRRALKSCPLDSAEHFNLLTNVGYCLIHRKEFDEAFELLAVLHDSGEGGSETPAKLSISFAKQFFQSGDVQSGVKLLQIAVDKLQPGNYDFAEMATLLISHRCFKPAASVWQAIFNVSAELPTDVQVVLPVVRRKLEEDASNP